MHRTWSSLAVLAMAAGLVACGGVDRGGSRSDIVDAMRDQGIEADVDCVGHVLDGFSDGALKAIDEQLHQPASSDPRTAQFLDALRACSSTTTIPTTPATTVAP